MPPRTSVMNIPAMCNQTRKKFAADVVKVTTIVSFSPIRQLCIHEFHRKVNNVEAPCCKGTWFCLRKFSENLKKSSAVSTQVETAMGKQAFMIKFFPIWLSFIIETPVKLVSAVKFWQISS